MGNASAGVERVRATKGVDVIDARSGTDPGDGDYVSFHATGDAVKGEYRCSGCGYGVAVVRDLPACPMCGGTAWEESTWSPFSRVEPLL
jgi:rubrerythrin